MIKRAGELLRAAAAAGDLNFYGNVEGNDIFKGTTDIVVCDGFVGNVALKTTEGLAAMLGDFLREEFTRNAVHQAGGAGRLCRCSSASRRRVDHRRYNGAALLGLRGLVFKSHGSADAFAFEQALDRAYDAARNDLLDRVHGPHRPTPRPLLARRRAGDAGRRRRLHPRSMTPLFAHHRHRQLPAAAPRDQRRARRANWPRDGVETSDEWIVERTGIRARHFADAGRHAQRPRRCRPRGTRSRRPAAAPATIDLIIVATSTPDMVFPSTACHPAEQARHRTAAPAFDVQAVCTASSTRWRWPTR